MIHNVEKYLFSLETKGVKLGLSRTVELLKRCKSPHQDIPIIQILGTNGKGSASAILYKLLRSEYNVGLYTSPHLYSFCERIRYNGASIPIEYIKSFLSQYQKTIEAIDASFFEVMTVMAIWYFKQKKVDYAIMETGLGGKFDSVTACNSKIFGITSISMDHTHILGDNLKSITKEKIAAIKPSSTIYTVPQTSDVENLIRKECKIKESNLFLVPRNNSLNISLKGDHQKENASLSLQIARDLLTIWDQGSIDKCLASINWHGRNQILSKRPDVIFDVAHNEGGIKSFLNFIKKDLHKKYSKKTLLFSIQRNKSINNIAKELSDSFDRVIYSKTHQKYSMDFHKIKKYFTSAEYIKFPRLALKEIIDNSQEDELIAIVGTHYWGDSIKNFFNICFDNI